MLREESAKVVEKRMGRIGWTTKGRNLQNGIKTPKGPDYGLTPNLRKTANADLPLLRLHIRARRDRDRDRVLRR